MARNKCIIIIIIIIINIRSAIVIVNSMRGDTIWHSFSYKRIVQDGLLRRLMIGILGSVDDAIAFQRWSQVASLDPPGAPWQPHYRLLKLQISQRNQHQLQVNQLENICNKSETEFTMQWLKCDEIFPLYLSSPSSSGLNMTTGDAEL